MEEITVDPVEGASENIYISVKSYDEGISSFTVYAAKNLDQAIEQSLKKGDSGFGWHENDFKEQVKAHTSMKKKVGLVRLYLSSDKNLVDGDSHPRIEVLQLRVLTDRDYVPEWYEGEEGGEHSERKRR